MLMSPEQEALIGRVFEAYLTEHHHDDILQLNTDASEETHYPVVVNAMTLFEANMEVGDFFNAYPNEVLAIFDDVLQRKAVEISDDASRVKQQRLRQTLHTRITGLPVCPELIRHTIPRSRDVGHFLSVTGTVIRTSVAKVLEHERDYMCTKCRHVFKVQAEFDQFYTFVPPVICPSPVGCNSYRFSCLSDGSEPAACRDYQEIKIQEQVQRLTVGSVPRSLVVVLEDDLVDRCKSGDDVTVFGVICLRWKPFSDGACCDVELVLKANNMEVNNQQAAAALLSKDVQREFEDFWSSYRHNPIAGRNQILSSLCPQVFGMYVIKLAVAMVLAGGVQRTDSSGTRIRGECHMLLVGDPGTGKSQFLKYAAKVVSRSVLTAGIGSTSAGLTVAAVKDGGDWHLEAGALVLSDGGLCCIDEFNSIKEHDRISIHEAMEQQSISVAKAGIVCKLNTRATILAATNPKGQYDPNEPLSVNVALASPLLSRFDLVLVLLDTKNAEWDRIISSFILEDRGLPAESSALWSMEKMKAYFSAIKQLQPQVSEQANCILTRYYQLQRQSDTRSAARTTIRMLESLSRLAEAHARLMFRETVTIEDAVVAVSVMECSMQGGALLGNVNTLLTSFPADPVHQYWTQCQALLEGLDLPLLLHHEMDRLSRLRSSSSEDLDPHQLSTSDSINTTRSLNISTDGTAGVSEEGGLDGFCTISPPVTSTQFNQNRSLNSGWSIKHLSCQTEEDDVSNTDTPHLLETSTFALEDNENKSRGDRRKNETCQEMFGSKFHEVSRNLMDRRVQYDEENRGEHGDGAPHPASDYHPNTPSAQDGDSRQEEEERGLIGMKNSREKMENHTDLQVKLSGFIFKPKKMRPSVQNIAIPAEKQINPGLNPQNPQNLLRRPDPNPQNLLRRPDPVPQNLLRRPDPVPQNLLRRPDPVPQNLLSRPDPVPQNLLSRPDPNPLPNARKRKMREKDETENGPEAGSSSLSGRLRDVGSLRKHEVEHGDVKERKYMAVVCSDNSPNIRNPRSAQTTTAVASSAAAKLSRFSFSSIDPPTAQSNETKRPLQRDGVELNSSQRRTEPAENMEEGTTQAAAGDKQPSIKQTDLCPPAIFMVDDGPVGSLRKRGCFRLGPANDSSKPVPSGWSLFTSSESCNDVLDMDWDQEVL
ncbi:DNA helicase MCM9 [Melanotaenia boesemani]|uniref:DNA helicase MCM9 n=1 Tax=Melanotaenia boesemani TaxID=1250792 RepID=UPI001C057E1A|nr:DNA helicase MCM9 [Melanotaenia boesemani]